MSRYLTNLADVVRRSGLTVHEVDGWKTRGHGPMDDKLTGVVCHHTAGPKTGDHPSLGVVTNGRPGLAGPLSHLLLSRSGEVHVVAAGLCWHAGAVRNIAWTNRHMIGIEAEATGVDAWPAVQLEAYARLCAELARGYSLKVDNVLGHKEVCDPPGRKIDPNFSMPAFRRDVVALLDRPAPTTPGKPAPQPGTNVPKAPRWPLPDGYYFGEKEGPRESVSGYYSHSADLKAWQSQMRARGWKIDVDGRFGPQTRDVAKAFQREKGIPVTGHIWPATWRAAWEAPVTK